MSEPGRPAPLFVVGIAASATPREAVQADHVYVIPPDALLTVQRGLFEVKPPTSAPERPWLVDRLFSSLRLRMAKANRHRAFRSLDPLEEFVDEKPAAPPPHRERPNGISRVVVHPPADVACSRPGQILKTTRTQLVWRAIGGNLHDVHVVLGEPCIGARRVCLWTPVADRVVMRGRDGVPGVGNDADLVLTHRGAPRDEDVSRLHV